jgi:hypothetical protein
MRAACLGFARPSSIDPTASNGYFETMAKAGKSLPKILGSLSEEHRQMVAEGMATMHRFAAEPSFKHGKPSYKGGNTVAAVAHAKTKRGR